MPDLIEAVGIFVRITIEFFGNNYSFHITKSKFHQLTGIYFYMMKGENVITISGESKIFTYHISNLIGKFHQLIPKKIIDVESNKILEGKKINSYIFVFLPNMFPIALTTEAFERKFHGNFQKFDDGKIYTSNIIYTEDQFLERLDTNSKNFPRIDSNPYETFIYEYDQYSHLIKINCIPTHNYKLLFGNITWKQECDSLIVTMM